MCDRPLLLAGQRRRHAGLLPRKRRVDSTSKGELGRALAQADEHLSHQLTGAARAALHKSSVGARVIPTDSQLPRVSPSLPPPAARHFPQNPRLPVHAARFCGPRSLSIKTHPVERVIAAAAAAAAAAAGERAMARFGAARMRACGPWGEGGSGSGAVGGALEREMSRDGSQYSLSSGILPSLGARSNRRAKLRRFIISPYDRKYR